MWNKWKESKLYQKLKQVRVNRAIYLSSIVILLALAVVLAITAITNRARRNDTGDLETLPPVSNQQPDVTQPSIEEKPTGNQPSTPTDSVPEMSLPVSGKLAKNHSAEVQVFSQTLQDFRVHLGIDIATDASAEVFAAADGSVQKIWEDPMMGWCIALKHSGNCTTVYKNLAKELAPGLAEGTQVKRGQLLGNVGESALMEIADESHLHMEMTVKGLQVNPLDYFSAAVVNSLSKDTAFEKPADGGK